MKPLYRNSSISNMNTVIPYNAVISEKLEVLAINKISEKHSKHTINTIRLLMTHTKADNITQKNVSIVFLFFVNINAQNKSGNPSI